MSTDANETPEVGSEAYNEQMVNKADAPIVTSDDPTTLETPNESITEKPEAVPDKFWDAENGVVKYGDWAKSTSELESKFTKQNQEDPEGGTENTSEGDTEGSLLPQESFDRFTQEFSENQELSEDSYAELEKAGIPKGYVDTYVEGLKALHENSEVNTLNQAGFESRETYDAATQWAAANLDPSDIEAFNEAVESGDPAAVTHALTELNKDYSAAKGTQTSTLLNGDSAVSESGGYASKHEMTTAMSDPRYAKDPAYRNMVMNKVALSNI